MVIYAALLAVLYAGSCMGQGFGVAPGGGLGGGGGGGAVVDPKCYIPCPDYTLADAFPFVRQTPISLADCQNLCNQLQTATPPFICASVVFDSQYGSCDIFAVSDQSSSGFGRRKRGGGGGGGGQKIPHKVKYPGRIYLQPTGACAGQGGNATGGGSTAASTATTSAGGAGGGGGGGAASTTTAATTSASAKKKIKDQQPLRRKDYATRCIAARTEKGHKDCTRGIKFVGRSRQYCTPTSAECRNS